MSTFVQVLHSYSVEGVCSSPGPRPWEKSRETIARQESNDVGSLQHGKSPGRGNGVVAYLSVKRRSGHGRVWGTEEQALYMGSRRAE